MFYDEALASTIRGRSGARKGVLLSHAMLSLVVGLVAICQPFLTNDGPIHLSIAHLFLSHFADPLQASVYRVNPAMSPNVAADLLMAWLGRVMSLPRAEGVMQAMCLTIPAWGCLFCVDQINRRHAWLSLVIYPLAMNQLLFLGLYNTLLSFAAYFVCIGFWFRYRARGMLRDALGVSLSLIGAYLCHAGGFIVAWCSIAAISAVWLGEMLLSRRPWRELLPLAWLTGALLLPLPLLAEFTLGKPHTILMFGVDPVSRILQSGRLLLLRVVYLGGLVGCFLAAMLQIVLALSLWRFARGLRCERAEGQLVWTLDKARAGYGIALFLCAFAIMVVFPDHAAGGFTHYRRFAMFPYFALVTALAALLKRPWESAAIGLLAAAGYLPMVASMALLQARIDREMVALGEVDRHIGAHCTILPIVLRQAPLGDDGKLKYMAFQPFEQASSLLELHDDRVVLYNFLFRLGVYPAEFRPGAEPQSGLFHWAPEQEDPAIGVIDARGFEAQSGLKIDYILVWGERTATPALNRALAQALTGVSPTYRSQNRLLTLYRRSRPGESPCTAPPEPVPAGQTV